MKILIPVSQSDVHLLPLHADALVRLGPMPGHEIILVPTRSTEALCITVAEKLREVCPTVTVLPMPKDFEGGWPIAPNNHWYSAVLAMAARAPQEPWLWLELDAVPLVPKWADQLQNAYRAAQKPFFGTVKPVLRRDASGARSFKEGDNMLMGVAIYPPGIPNDILIKPLFYNVGKSKGFAIREPFDLYLRWVFKKRGVADSPLICDMWRSENYVRDGDRIKCSPVAGEPNARSGAIPLRAVLVHGCKDGSLHRLIAGGETELPVVRSGYLRVVTETPTPAPDFKVTTAAPIEAATTFVVAEDLPPVETAAPQAEVTDQAVLDHLKKGKIRLKNLAEHFGVSVNKMEAQIMSLGYVATGPGWVNKSKF